MIKNTKWLFSALANGWRLNIIYFISESKTRSLSIGGRTLLLVTLLLILGSLWAVAATSGLFWTMKQNNLIKSEFTASQELLFESQMEHDGILEKLYSEPEKIEPNPEPNPASKNETMNPDAGNISQSETEKNAG